MASKGKGSAERIGGVVNRQVVVYVCRECGEMFYRVPVPEKECHCPKCGRKVALR